MHDETLKVVEFFCLGGWRVSRILVVTMKDVLVPRFCWS